MEHRWTERREARLDVAFYRQGRPATICKSRNVSLEGMYLEVDARALDLRIGTPVELVLRLPHAAPGRRHSAKALVRHCDDVGVGLMLTAVAPELSMALRATCDGAPAPPFDDGTAGVAS